jgi:hypothetical protein
MQEPSDKFAVAAEQCRKREQQHARIEFAKPGWSKWRVYSWIAYRDPERICTIEDSPSLGALRRYGDKRHYANADEWSNLLDKAPEQTLLRALQEGELVALDGDGNELHTGYWLVRTPRDIGDVMFRKTDVLLVWPGMDRIAHIGEQATQSRVGNDLPKSKQRRGAYRGALEQYMAGLSVTDLLRMSAEAIAQEFKAHCTRERADLLDGLPRRPRSMVPQIEKIKKRRIAIAKSQQRPTEANRH